MNKFSYKFKSKILLISSSFLCFQKTTFFWAVKIFARLQSYGQKKFPVVKISQNPLTKPLVKMIKVWLRTTSEWFTVRSANIDTNQSKQHCVIPTELGNLPKSGIIAEIKRLYDEGYQLGLDEGKEITRGKYLNIFSNGTLGNRKKWEPNQIETLS